MRETFRRRLNEVTENQCKFTKSKMPNNDPDSIIAASKATSFHATFARPLDDGDCFTVSAFVKVDVGFKVEFVKAPSGPAFFFGEREQRGGRGVVQDVFFQTSQKSSRLLHSGQQLSFF